MFQCVPYNAERQAMRPLVIDNLEALPGGTSSRSTSHGPNEPASGFMASCKDDMTKETYGAEQLCQTMCINYLFLMRIPGLGHVLLLPKDQTFIF